jgi:hypothetical protein
VLRGEPPFSLGLNPHDFATQQEAHDVNVVRCEVEDNADVADALRERSDAASMNLVHAAEFTSIETALEFADGRVEPLDVANR